jgi:glycosyltransferase involved in cell wall biosynthesis
MTPSPTVTVMIPSYNYAQYLVECVNSALDQPGVNVDVVLVENASTDGSVALAEDLASAHPNVRLVRYDDNQGIMCSLNRCYAEIRGDYALLLCADDLLVPGALARSVSFLEAHSGVSMVYGPALDFSSIEEVDPSQLYGTPAPPLVYDGAGWIDGRCRSGRNPIRTPEVLMRASTIAAVGGRLDPRCPHTSDLNMWLRLASRGDVAFLPGPPVALYRRHESNHGNAFTSSALRGLEARWDAFSAFFETVATDPSRDRWEQTIRGALAAEARYLATRAFSQCDGDEPCHEVEELLDFADRLQPGGASSAEALGWKLRRALGHRRADMFPGFWPRRLSHRLQGSAAERHRLGRGL